MKCTQFRKMMGASDYASGDAEQLPLPLREHLEVCPGCRRWLAHTRAVSKMVRDLPPADPSAGFTASVMAGLSAHRPGLIQRLLHRLAGPLRAPAPLVPGYQLVAAACILLVIVAGGAFYSAQLGSGAAPLDTGTGIGLVAADGTTPGSAHTPIAIGAAHDASRPARVRSSSLAVDDLIFHHDSYELTRPLGSDPGIRFINHSAE